MLFIYKDFWFLFKQDLSSVKQGNEIWHCEHVVKIATFGGEICPFFFFFSMLKVSQEHCLCFKLLWRYRDATVLEEIPSASCNISYIFSPFIFLINNMIREFLLFFFLEVQAGSQWTPWQEMRTFTWMFCESIWMDGFCCLGWVEVVLFLLLFLFGSCFSIIHLIFTWRLEVMQCLGWLTAAQRAPAVWYLALHSPHAQCCFIISWGMCFSLLWETGESEGVTRGRTY